MSKINGLNLSEAMLQRGRLPHSVGHPTALPVSEMAMVLTLDQLRPNPDNPRATRNPKFEDIKASIRSRGLDSIPKVTRDPDGEDAYIFSDGGNSRYQILCELWQETGDDRFYHIHSIFKPWPGRLQCVIGHLAENEIRGDLTYIEKALGIHKARILWEEQQGRGVSLRELSEFLNQQGYPIHNSSISRMEDTLKYLYPCLPDLLDAGLSRSQVIPLITLRSAAEKMWSRHVVATDCSKTFEAVFSAVCTSFNCPDLYSLDMFRDELIGELLKALPHPLLNYDRWLIELDPKEQQRRELYGDPLPPPSALTPDANSVGISGAPLTKLPPQPNGAVPEVGLRSGTLTGPLTKPESAPDNRGDTSVNRPQEHLANIKTPPNLCGGPVIISGNANLAGANLLSTVVDESAGKDQPPASSVAFAATGLEPVDDIWHIPALMDDVEHLQDMAYRLAFELSEAMGCADSIAEYKQRDSAGYSTLADSTQKGNTNRFVTFLLGLTGHSGQESISLSIFCQTFLGSADQSDPPVLDDIHLVKIMRLMRVLRRLRQLQRDANVAINGGLL